MDVVVLFGPPGSGKGTQTQFLVQRLGFQRISTGDIIRGEIKEGSVLGKITQDYQRSGQLVPDELVDEMVANRIKVLKDSRGLVFDGYPRTAGQARALDILLRGLPAVRNVHILYFDISLEAVSRRIANRLCCDVCHSVFSRGELALRVGSDCPECGAPLVSRPDDSPDVVGARFAVFQKELGPILSYYDSRIIRVECDLPSSQVFLLINSILGDA